MIGQNKSKKLEDRVAAALERFASSLEALDGPQQALARQIIILIEKIGGRSAAADAVGVGKTTLDNYRTGKTQPKFLELLALCSAAGVPLTKVMEEEELLGRDAVRVIVSPELYAGPEISAEILAEIGEMIAKLHEDAGIKLSKNNQFRLAAEGYNRITDQAADQYDFEELRSLIPWVKLTFKRDIEAQKSQPGTGKLSAS